MLKFSRCSFLWAFVSAVGLAAGSLTAQAVDFGGAEASRLGTSARSTRSLELNTVYRLGSEWGKREVTTDDLESNEVLARAAKATARLGGGTSFYLGKFNGKHVLATNHHVCPVTCLNYPANFTMLGISAKVVEFYGTWPTIDLSLMAIRLSPEQESVLASVAGNFAFDFDLFPGQELITVGHGSANNPAGRLVVNMDSDCKVFSGENEFRLMADPDALNPGPYKAWSFANGCDVSHGDSGSAMVDRQSGAVVGIIWTGKIPKQAIVQDSSYLDQLLSSNGPEIWTELSYAVPAKKIGEYLQSVIDEGGLSTSVKATIEAVIAH